MNEINIILCIILSAIAVFSIIGFVLSIVNSAKISGYLDYGEDGDLMSAIKEYYDKIDKLTLTVNRSSNAVINNRLADCENGINSSLRKVGLVNFNAFDDITGQMSFSLTILDNYNNGIILTSLYGHNSCNTYIRKITDGKAEVKLLEEEIMSLKQAVENEKKVTEDDE